MWLFDSPLVLPLGISSASEEVNRLRCDLCALSLFNSCSVLFVYLLFALQSILLDFLYVVAPFLPFFFSLSSFLTRRLRSAPRRSAASSLRFCQFAFRAQHSDVSFQLTLLFSVFHPPPSSESKKTFSSFTTGFVLVWPPGRLLSPPRLHPCTSLCLSLCPPLGGDLIDRPGGVT